MLSVIQGQSDKLRWVPEIGKVSRRVATPCQGLAGGLVERWVGLHPFALTLRTAAVPTMIDAAGARPQGLGDKQGGVRTVAGRGPPGRLQGSS